MGKEMFCGKCSIIIPDHDEYEHAGQTLCEDCYIAAISKPKTCDPWAVYSATRTISQGEILTSPQQKILELIRSRGPLSLEEICNLAELDEQDFRRHFSTLRHMELAQACKENEQISYIPFKK